MGKNVIVEIKTEHINLDSLLKLAGICQTGGEAKNRIAFCEVKVDGEIEIRRGRKIRPENEVEIAGELIKVKYQDEQVNCD